MIADDIQKSVLLRLHDQLDESKVELSADEIIQGFKPKIDPLKVQNALENVVFSGFAVSVGQLPTRYRISRAGINMVEQAYKITTTLNPSTGIVHRSYSEVPTDTRQNQPAFDWAKWGSIAAIAAVPLAILLWWLT